MKKLILFVIAIFCLNILNAQKVVTGSFQSTPSLLKVEYKEISVFTENVINEDKAILYITDDYTFCKTEFLEQSFTKEDIMANDSSSVVVDDDNDDKYFNQIYVNRKENKLTEYVFETTVLKKNYAVEENQPQMEWKILGNQKQISGFNCENAKVTFRGRTYEVWYTPEIPISSGPWKFNGLPGIILSVKDLDGIYSWEATSVKKINSNEFNLSKYLQKTSSFTKISYKDFDDKIIKTKIDNNKIFNTRAGDNFKMTFSTSQFKEPKNEWRSQTYFE